jgi:rfaE bifunctional protein kinase chain/domain
MKSDQLKKILKDISSVKIIVVGDFCLDAYWFIDEAMSEISVETNQPTRPVRQQKYSLGGAGNVTNNLAALGVKDIRAFGVIGTDPFGTEMVTIMNAAGIRTENMLVQTGNWSTHTYAKPYIGDNELSRVDFGNYNKLAAETADQLISNLIREIPKADIIIINQQVPSGIHTDYFKKKLLGVIGKFPEKAFITDSRNFNDFYKGTIRKMNDTEASRLCGHTKKPDEQVPYSEVVTFAKKLYSRFGKPLFITRGSKGSVTIDDNGITEIPGLMIISKVDTVGAGDSYLAGAATALAAGYSMEIAAAIGTLVAGVTVQKLFTTGTATPEEIMSIGEDPDFIYAPELAENIRQASYLKKSEIEIINKNHEKPKIRHAIFDHDGTISTLREGWELIMAPMMVKAILGDKFETAEEPVYRKILKSVDEFIDKTTGIQTLAQMKSLVELVKEAGFVDKKLILDEFGYKEIYNDELLRMVRAREAKLKNGELTIEDLTLKGAVPFLKKLYEAGIKLYLASGTDIEDVKREADVMGYAGLFEERIFGAVGDVNKEAKKIVLDNILDSLGNSISGRVVTFGDGLVEIRETRKRNGITVGVASNELRRFGLNEKKRTRLIKAGADYVIPDFSRYNDVLALLNIK